MDLSVHPDQIAVMFVVFAACLATLHFLVFKPTLVILKEREKRLSGMAHEARNLESRHAESLASYNKVMDQAKSVARATREDMIKSAEAEQKRVLNEARAQSEALIASAKQKLAAEAGESRLKLRQYAQELSQAMVQKILKRKAA